MGVCWEGKWGWVGGLMCGCEKEGRKGCAAFESPSTCFLQFWVYTSDDEDKDCFKETVVEGKRTRKPTYKSL